MFPGSPGVDHSVLKQVGEQFLNIRGGAGTTGAKAQYRGGEVRLQSIGSLVHSAVVSQSAAAGTSEALAFSVLQHLLGAGPHVKRGSSVSSKLVQGVAKATAEPFDVIKAALTQAKAVADGGVTAADLTRAKAQLKGHFLMSLETSEGLLEAMGSQALADGSYHSPEEISKNIDNVSLTDLGHLCSNEQQSSSEELQAVGEPDQT
ncbi:hypothetical protein GOODEAATRI_021753 [Goodea atripinnis]|uniref:Uncharacterized protein n=1 Tax=Goodea atripinnis TaxID=208336 RepID=A0ABV0PQU4_9TELE